jgi:hypothetical protein
MEVFQKGYQDYYYENFEDEVISIGRPKVLAKNIVLGTIYIDVTGEIEAINHKTREKAVIKFFSRGWNSMSYLTG